MKAKHTHGLHALRKTVDHLRGAARARVRRALRQIGIAPPQTAVMLELFRPQLRHTPDAWRRYVQPLVALAATAVLVSLAAIGIGSLAMFIFAIALMYAVLNQVFGIELGLNMPQTNL